MLANVGIAPEASQLAFQIGQQLERLLLDHGMEMASKAGAANLTAEQIESCLVPSLFDELVASLKGNVENGFGDRRTEEPETWEAA